MRLSNIIIAICLVAISTAEKIILNPGDDTLSISSSVGFGMQENLFELETCEGCKMQALCYLGTYSCSLSKILVDNGREYIEHCPEDIGTFMEVSQGNVMTIKFETYGFSTLSFCDIDATKPYLDVPEPVIDSREHGLIQKGKTPTSCKCGWTNKPPSRIVGGKRASVNEYSFIALIVMAYDGSPFCGGSIITKRHILTAAHCTYGVRQQVAVVVGEHDINRRSESSYTRVHLVQNIYEHPSYSFQTSESDIALLEVAEPIEFNEVVGPVCLPHVQENLVGQYIKVMGWGYILDRLEGGDASSTLRKVNLRVIDPEICKVLYGIDTRVPSQICTYNNNKDSCEGDSGGPLVYLNTTTNTYYQVALVSFGRRCGSTDPAVNTDVAHYMRWIDRQIARSRYPTGMCQ